MFFVFDSAAKIFRLFVVRHFLEYRVGQGGVEHDDFQLSNRVLASGYRL